MKSINLSETVNKYNSLGIFTGRVTVERNSIYENNKNELSEEFIENAVWNYFKTFAYKGIVYIKAPNSYDRFTIGSNFSPDKFIPWSHEAKIESYDFIEHYYDELRRIVESIQKNYDRMYRNISNEFQDFENSYFVIGLATPNKSFDDYIPVFVTAQCFDRGNSVSNLLLDFIPCLNEIYDIFNNL